MTTIPIPTKSGRTDKEIKDRILLVTYFALAKYAASGYSPDRKFLKDYGLEPEMCYKISECMTDHIVPEDWAGASAAYFMKLFKEQLDKVDIT